MLKSWDLRLCMQLTVLETGSLVSAEIYSKVCVTLLAAWRTRTRCVLPQVVARSKKIKNATRKRW